MSEPSNPRTVEDHAYTLLLSIREPQLTSGNRFEVRHAIDESMLVHSVLSPVQIIDAAIGDMRGQILGHTPLQSSLKYHAEKSVARTAALEALIADLEARLFSELHDDFWARSQNGFIDMPTDAEIWAEVREGSPLTRNAHEDLAALTAAARSLEGDLPYHLDENDGGCAEKSLQSLRSLLNEQSGGAA